ncbi:hypothetical protein EBA29_00358 [Bacillus velezensis]|uniref:Uncharacterized protein n=1 Tax=Bacillus amyloliquefaciens (strain Y2) TaxID=1155777 RepID=I2C1A6_BACAY|nr:hypothetical protein MUS_0348 [Bacillus velezensis YAU B9601-Y2]QAR55429.1 hypothetical protein EBA29_00358 [Bacillus velezensis]RAP16634.1 hypothetical protein C2W63_03539 [Bacillus velezensis]RUS03444.1 hypothetical protein EFW58_03899 [Bacillus velezensis]
MAAYRKKPFLVFFIFFLYGKRLCTAESLYKFCVIEKDKKGE